MIYDSVTAGRMVLELTCQLYQTVIYGKVPVPPTETLHGPMIFFTGLLPRSKFMQMPSELPSLIPTNRPLCDYPNHYIAPSPARNDRTNDTPLEPAPPCLQNPVLIRPFFSRSSIGWQHRPFEDSGPSRLSQWYNALLSSKTT